MKKFYPIILALSLLALNTLTVTGQGKSQLPRSIPEAEGVSSSEIIDFINAVDSSSGVEVHSFMFIRHSKVIAESWWAPYKPEYKHIMYSASKTFTATAIGLAISEGRLNISDKVASFFPYSLPDTIGKNMNALTVQNLLTMSVGQENEPMAYLTKGDWITQFLEAEPEHEPGTVFKYNNMATFMLSAIVQQVTGETVFDYLKPRIFKPLGIQGIDWDLNPQGINLGMAGLRLRTEDMAKFGQLLIQDGIWDKKQLIPKEWIEEATSFKIDSYDPPNKAPKEMNDWEQGYAYQMWRGRNNTVRLDGMAGQFVVLAPDKDAIIVLTSNSKNTQKELNLVHEFLLPAIKSGKAIEPNPGSYKELQEKEASLISPPLLMQKSNENMESKISGKEFALASNNFDIQSIYLSFTNKVCTFALKRNNAVSSIKAGLEKWQISNTQNASLLAPSSNNFSKSIDANYTTKPPIKVGAIYSWQEDNKLEITARFVEESIGCETITLEFNEQGGIMEITIKTQTSIRGTSRSVNPEILRGSMIIIE